MASRPLATLKQVSPMHGDEITIKRAADGRVTRHRFFEYGPFCAWLDLGSWAVASIPPNPFDARGEFSVDALGDEFDMMISFPDWWADPERGGAN